VLTFAEGASALASYVTEGLRQSTPVPAPRAVHVDLEQVRKAREAFNVLLRAMKETSRVVERHHGLPAAPAVAFPAAAADALRTLRDFLDLELAAATPPAPTVSSVTTG